jgi:hypothetical protein
LLSDRFRLLVEHGAAAVLALAMFLPTRPRRWRRGKGDFISVDRRLVHEAIDPPRRPPPQPDGPQTDRSGITGIWPDGVNVTESAVPGIVASAAVAPSADA